MLNVVQLSITMMSVINGITCFMFKFHYSKCCVIMLRVFMLSVIMLNVINGITSFIVKSHYVKFSIFHHYAECRYAECRYAGCHSATPFTLFVTSGTRLVDLVAVGRLHPLLRRLLRRRTGIHSMVSNLLKHSVFFMNFSQKISKSVSKWQTFLRDCKVLHT
jgi:hypothetical protein